MLKRLHGQPAAGEQEGSSYNDKHVYTHFPSYNQETEGVTLWVSKTENPGEIFSDQQMKLVLLMPHREQGPRFSDSL